MADSMKKPQKPCHAEFKCRYKVGDACVFGDQLKALLSVLQEKYHQNESCIVDLFDIFREPCSEMDEEEHDRGVIDILGL